jgi:AbrB family looped-hinge helix DNA binding protein
MNALTVTTKGQVTLKKELLQHLGIRPGEKIEVDELPDGELRIRAFRRTGKISDAFGMLKVEGRKALTIEEINDITAKGWAGEL